LSLLIAVMDQNHIIADRWSNDDSERLYQLNWPDEPALKHQCEKGQQCGGCSFFAPFNFDWGLCCHAKSRHRLETVFEHFTCNFYVHEGWNTHSFRETPLDDLLESGDCSES
jgi:hypothetical protein